MKKYKVIDLSPRNDSPKDLEFSAAQIIADYFKTDVIFQRVKILSTPDLIVKGRTLELKSPIGDSKNTISNNIKTARKQSESIVIDLMRCKMNEVRAISRIKAIYKKRKRKTGSYYIICKDKKILDVAELV